VEVNQVPAVQVVAVLLGEDMAVVDLVADMAVVDLEAAVDLVADMAEVDWEGVASVGVEVNQILAVQVVVVLLGEDMAVVDLEEVVLESMGQVDSELEVEVTEAAEVPRRVQPRARVKVAQA
jgi:hypothetical protein